jgi:hypothetical protein
MTCDEEHVYFCMWSLVNLSLPGEHFVRHTWLLPRRRRRPALEEVSLSRDASVHLAVPQVRRRPALSAAKHTHYGLFPHGAHANYVIPEGPPEI